MSNGACRRQPHYGGRTARAWVKAVAADAWRYMALLAGYNASARLLVPLIALTACARAGERPDARTGWTPIDSARVDAILAPLVAGHAFMGAVAFVRDGKVVYARGAGKADVAADVDFTPSTPADGGSLAKTLTAAAVWTLVHEGRIAIDTPVIAYVREYPYAGTTVRQLITHTNGLPPAYEEFDRYFGPHELRTTVALLTTVRRAMPQPRFTPGTRFEYSNLGFDAAALVVERVTGQSIARYFRERFFSPLGMDASFARPGRLADFPAPRTLGHRWADTAWMVADVFDNEAFVGGSNVYFSALDLARWAGAHATGTALAPAIRALGEPRAIFDGHPSSINGLSWYCDDSAERCHYTGDINAFHSLAYWDRASGSAVAMLSNSDLAPWTLITLQRDLVAVLAGREPDRRPRPTFVAVDDARREAVVGRYVAPGGDTIRVVDSRDGLRMRIGRGLDFDAFHITPDMFYVPGLDYFVGFSRDADELRLHVRSMFVDFVVPRLP
jgi:CubicO group peptidase (beta-lactamase class C family)